MEKFYNDGCFTSTTICTKQCYYLKAVSYKQILANVGNGIQICAHLLLQFIAALFRLNS